MTRSSSSAKQKSLTTPRRPRPALLGRSRRPLAPSVLLAHTQILRGLTPLQAQTRIRRSGLPLHVMLAAWGISDRTLKRKIAAGERLGPRVSKRALRLEAILQRADELFGNREVSARWLLSPALPLGGRSPIDFLTTSVGATTVEDYLGRISYGAVA